jgi:hypothetical protein
MDAGPAGRCGRVVFILLMLSAAVAGCGARHAGAATPGLQRATAVVARGPAAPSGGGH